MIKLKVTENVTNEEVMYHVQMTEHDIKDLKMFVFRTDVEDDQTKQSLYRLATRLERHAAVVLMLPSKVHVHDLSFELEDDHPKIDTQKLLDFLDESETSAWDESAQRAFEKIGNLIRDGEFDRRI